MVEDEVRLAESISRGLRAGARLRRARQEDARYPRPSVAGPDQSARAASETVMAARGGKPHSRWS